MYKLLIVEDEERIRKSMISSIDWNSFGFQVVAEATNGKEALELVCRNAPDCVLTDVRMPLMDGLELARMLNRDYPAIKILVLSGYSDFDFVRSALKARVFDYLLKPTDIAVFKETFRNLKLVMDAERRHMAEEKEKKQYIEQNFSQMQNDLLSKLLDGLYDEEESLLDTMEFLEIDVSAPAYIAVVIRMKFVEGALGTAKHTACHCVVSAIPFIAENAMCVSKAANEIVLIFRCDEQLEDDLLGCVNEALRLLSGLPHISDVSAGVGTCCPFLYKINESYATAILALEERFYNSDAQIFSFQTKNPNKPSIKPWPDRFAKQLDSLVVAAISGNADFCIGLVDALFTDFNKSQVDPRFVKDYCCVMIFLVKQSIPQNHLLPAISPMPDNALDTIDDVSSIKELHRYIGTFIRDVCHFVVSLKEANGFDDKQKLIGLIKAYLSDNYHKNISLNELSNKFHYSAPYISFLFSSTVGENYVDYIRKLRMQRAVDLLKQGNFKVQEIAKLVGYNDYRYFAIQFKKTYGMSPSKYVLYKL